MPMMTHPVAIDWARKLRVSAAHLARLDDGLSLLQRLSLAEGVPGLLVSGLGQTIDESWSGVGLPSLISPLTKRDLLDFLTSVDDTVSLFAAGTTRALVHRVGVVPIGSNLLTFPAPAIEGVPVLADWAYRMRVTCMALAAVVGRIRQSQQFSDALQVAATYFPSSLGTTVVAEGGEADARGPVTDGDCAALLALEQAYLDHVNASGRRRLWYRAAVQAS